MAAGTHSMIFATGEPAFAVGGDGAIVGWNSAASRAFGYPSSQAVGRKCWDLLQGQDPFGNQYCCERCPLLAMAVQHKPVNRCRMSFRTADEKLQGFTVTTLLLFDLRGVTLIHLCRAEVPASREKGPIAPVHESVHESGRESGRGHGEGVLTHRERQVLNHLADGHTTREIATLLSISGKTVRNHIEHILHKLHAHSRLEAVAVSRRLDLH